MLYFNAAIDSEWNTLGNWWNDGAFTDPALALPTAGDDLEIWQPVLTVNTGIGFPYAQSVTVQTTGYLTQAIYNFVGGTLPGISFFGVSGWVTDTYYVAGRPSSLPESGTGYWFGQGYFIAGVVTLLPESGTGWDSILNDYFIAGVATSGAVDGNGSGFFGGLAYYQGVNVATGHNDHFYYVDNVQTDLDFGGYGLYDGIYYGGNPFPTLANGHYDSWTTTALDNNKFYLEGVETTLESSGSGVYLGHVYSGGTLQPTGYIDTADGTAGYYIDDVHTDLDSNGNGIWETRNYAYGVSLGQPGTDKRWLLYTAGVSDPLDWHLSSNWLSYSTDWEGGVGGEAGAIPTAVDNVRINGACPKYDSNMSATCDVLSVTTVDSFDYWESWGINCTTATISGINRLAINAATAISVTGTGVNYGSLTGPTTFSDTASNATENYSSAYHKGICNSATTFTDTSSNGGTLVPDGTAYGAYHLAIVVGTASFRDSSTNAGWCGDAVFYDAAKNMLGIQGTSTLSYSQGINGTGILGTL